MKNIALTAVVTLVLSLSIQAFAFSPYVEGKRTMALEDANGKVLVEAGIVKRVNDNETLKTWIEAKIFELTVLMNSMPKDDCNS